MVIDSILSVFLLIYPYSSGWRLWHSTNRWFRFPAHPVSSPKGFSCSSSFGDRDSIRMQYFSLCKIWISGWATPIGSRHFICNTIQTANSTQCTRHQWICNLTKSFVAFAKYCDIMTSSNGSIFRVTGHLCGEFTGHRWIPCTKASDAELWCFLWSAPE